MWLIDKNQNVDNPNVVAWYPKDEGLVLRYQNKPSGTMLIEIAHDSEQLKKLQNLTVEMHEIINNNQEISLKEEALFTSNISLQNNSRDE